ncbi:hypothetical protein [Paenibacillus pini]|uniref:Uncharacterized protein n=1 Tax=Paenibacillus pini JCM 16418 TaxID=1236976 RepID=W7Z1B3_9BACL|nr:hypothetical protein [Paenibacillus pini]GAF10781.1 hypothetical protein JCM16418_5001 [Paenibacillus pini JCM 16418]
MNIIDSIRIKIEALQEYIDEINEQIEEDFDPMDWSGGNFDDCYELGYSHGRKFGRMTAYKEILAILESER